jgi:hypothetical protein
MGNNFSDSISLDNTRAGVDSKLSFTVKNELPLIITNLEKLRIKKMKLKIKRTYYEDCTLGRLTYGAFQCWTLELPMLDNAQNISCIYPNGGFKGRKHFSPNNGDCIAIDNVQGRTNIQIHSANYTSQILGCIAVGDSIKFLNEDSVPDVTNSRSTLEELLFVLPDSFDIEIT